MSRAKKKAPPPPATPDDDPAVELEELELEGGQEDDAESGVCRYCGCTEAAACPTGCEWADDAETICTVCEDLALELGYAALDTLVELEGPLER